MPAATRFAALLLAIACGACADQPRFDLIVFGGSVVDGTGAAARRADVGIKGDRIAAIGNLESGLASSQIDVTGKIVAPGFIDVFGRTGATIAADALAETHLRQGVTSEMLGPTDAAYADTLESRGMAINVGTLAPVSAGAASTAATDIDQAMRNGAFGAIADHGPTADDLNAAAAVVGRNDGALLISGDNAVVASDEALFAVGMRARHLVITGLANPLAADATRDVLGRIVRANQRGLATYGVVMPAAPPADAPAREALRYGGVMVTGFGAFPRLLGQMVRDEHVMELRDAVRRSTSMPASALGISQRGIIRQNWFADLVVLDERAIADRATADKPNQYPAGIDYVIVNGVVAVTPRGLTGARAGTRLLHQHAAGS